MDEVETRNAVIKSVSLEIEDHGTLTCWLHLEGSGWGVGYGGYGMDEPSYEHPGTRVGTSFGTTALRRILDTLKKSRWEDLPGTPIRVRGRLRAGDSSGDNEIGHYIEDRWFGFGELAREMKGSNG